MKKLLVIAIALASTNAFATRARLSSLANSNHIMDTQRIYMNPSDMFSFGDFVNLETGATAVAATAAGADAEGMIVRTMGDAKMGLSLGHRSENASNFGLRSIIAAANAGAAQASSNQQNPVELSYGMKMGDAVYAGTLVYSNYNDKQNKEKESSLGFRLGGRMGAWDFSWAQGLENKSTKDGSWDFKGKQGTSLYAGYMMDTMYFNGKVTLAEASLDDSTPTVAQTVKNAKSQSIVLNAVNSMKKDGSEFFYGASLTNTETKTEVHSGIDVKDTTMTLPLMVGMEVEAASWITLRGSLTQTLLINDNKRETTTGGVTTTNPETAPGKTNTVASVGAGLKFNKVQIDGSLTNLSGAAANAQLDGNTLLGKVGLTYMF